MTGKFVLTMQMIAITRIIGPVKPITTVTTTMGTPTAAETLTETAAEITTTANGVLNGATIIKMATAITTHMGLMHMGRCTAWSHAHAISIM